MAEPSQYEVNFFKPKSEATRANTKLISILVIIWVVAVFGSQFLLIALGKPVPEKTLLDFQTLWPKVQAAPTDAELQSFSRVMLMTLGKNATVKEADKKLMEEALAVSINLLDPGVESAEAASDAIGLGSSGFDPLLHDQLLYHYKTANARDYTALSGLPDAMKLYLTHNRSVLTDARFLGFPLHYYYTAQFLLILFIVLCLIYAKATDKMNTRLGIEDE
jgi:putative solute:sodium symporter small subunit